MTHDAIKYRRSGLPSRFGDTPLPLPLVGPL